MRSLVLAVVFTLAACGGRPVAPRAPAERWLHPSEMKPQGTAPGAQARVLATHADGTREIVLVLATGDEVMTALTAFVTAEKIEAARFTAVGALSGAEVAWFSAQRRLYKGMRFAEQLEMLALTGDVAVSTEGTPTVHAHATLGREDGSVVGGHLIAATVMPTLEVFITAYPTTLPKKLAPETGTQVIDLAPR